MAEKSERAKKEEEILKFWQANNIFEKSMAKPAGAEPTGEFVFYEGPPTANGKPGIHHLEARAFKDAIPRYQTMRGKRVRRQGGWDTHGLPVELAVEKALGLKSKKEVESYGIAAFNEKCKESVWTYVREWEEFTERIGYWIDLKHPYITYKSEYIEALWGIVKTAEEKKLLYKDYKVVPWCPRCGTALSSHELAQGYQDDKDLAVTVKFKLVASAAKNFFQVLGNNPQTMEKIFSGFGSAEKSLSGEVSLLAWTTTPWTLPGNVALAVGPAIEYVLVRAGEEQLVLAKARLEILKETAYEIVAELRGKDLVGLEYEPVFPFLQDKNNGNAFKVYPADFVTTEDGTGIVHIAPMYGQDDFELGTKNGLPKYHLVNDDGTFKAETGFLAGKFVKDEGTAVEIIKDLAGRGLLFAKEKYTHSYPHCWRCKTPLIYFARDSWYLRMSALRDELVKENEKINWEPANVKEGRFGEWLREIKDWAISRERYWGTPLPVWQCAECKERAVIGSVRELQARGAALNRYFVMRHGEAETNARGIVSSAVPGEYHLTARGREEVKETTGKLKEGKIDLIVASPVLRTRETAELAAEALGFDRAAIVFDERLREIDCGPWEGKTINEYHAGGRVGVEGEVAVSERLKAALAELELAYAGKTILLVTHQDVAGVLFPHQPAFVTGELRPYYHRDLHRPYIDEVKLKCTRQVGGQACGGEMTRVKEVMDVWFDSGAMPVATQRSYPADFIAEAIDQTRGWFYTLHAIGVLLGRGQAYKNVICLGHILDVEGKKMSKSLGNIVEPGAMLDKYGADALRFWMYAVNQPGESKNFDEKTVDEAVKKVLNLLTNVASFYTTYADRAVPASADSSNVLDRWIVARLNQLIELATEELNDYSLLEPARAIRDFIADLSQWYLRRSRDRFKSDDSAERVQAAATTRWVLQTSAQVLAPLLPFVAEEIWQQVKVETDAESVHLSAWPTPGEVDMKLIEEMRRVRELVSEGLELRAASGVKIRQPLASFTIDEDLPDEYLALIKDEVNVEEVKLGEMVALDTTLTDELKEKGELRELMRELQDWRKGQGLTPQELAVVPVPRAKQALAQKYETELKKAVRASGFEFVD